MLPRLDLALKFFEEIIEVRKFVLETELQVHLDRLDHQDHQVNPVMPENPETQENQAAMERQELLETRGHPDPQVDQDQLVIKVLMPSRRLQHRDLQGK